MIGVDTNVLVRALVDVDDPQHEAATAFLDSLTEQSQGFITQVTLVELYWVVHRALGIDRPSTLKVIRALIETPALEFEDGEGVVRALALAEEGADFADALIHASMSTFGVTETVTFDKAASRQLGWRLLG